MKNDFPISLSKEDILKAIENKKSLSFELDILKTIRGSNFESWSHGGTFVDHVTGKSRQFDFKRSREMVLTNKTIIKYIFTSVPVFFLAVNVFKLERDTILVSRR